MSVVQPSMMVERPAAVCVLLVGHMRTFRQTALTLRRRIRHRGVRYFVSTYATHETSSFNQRREALTFLFRAVLPSRHSS